MNAATARKRANLLHQVVGSVFSQIAVVALTVAIVSLRGRSLGPDGFGVLCLTLILPTLLYSMLNLGVGTSNIYFVARGDVTVQQALQTSRKIWLLLSVLGCAVGCAVIGWKGRDLFPDVAPHLLCMSLVAYPMLLLRMYNRSLLLAVENFRAANSLELLEAASMLLLTALTVWLCPGSVFGVLIAYLMAHALVLVVSWVWVRNVCGQNVSEPPKGYGLRCLQYGWKANLNFFLRFLNFRLDVLLIGYYLGSSAAGLYAAALVIAEKLCLIPQTASQAMLPRLASMHREIDARDRLTCFALRLCLLFGFAAALILGGLRGPLLTLGFGPEYDAAAIVLLWLLPGMVLEAFVLTIASNLAARGRVDLNLYRYGLLVVVNLLGNILLIPRLGIAGAAIASTFSYFVLALVTLHIFASLTGARWWTPFVPGDIDREALRRGLNGMRRLPRATLASCNLVSATKRPGHVLPSAELDVARMAHPPSSAASRQAA